MRNEAERTGPFIIKKKKAVYSLQRPLSSSRGRI